MTRKYAVLALVAGLVAASGCGTTDGVGTVEICDNGRDDDGDGFADCADRQCAAHPHCALAENCTNGRDDDGDGATDCADLDCSGDPACSGEVCDNNVDDDGDNLVDCADPGCATFPACSTRENCTNNVDDDGDGAVDCNDVDCAFDAACTGGLGTCASPTTLTDPATVNGDTTGQADIGGGTCQGVGGGDWVYEFTPTGDIIDITLDSAADMGVFVQTVCGGAEIDCVDSASAGGQETLTLTGVTPNQPVYIVVGGYDSTVQGSFTLTVASRTVACGNGVVEAGEQCDDGNTTPGDGCDASCQIEIACGNNYLSAGEECDDGNTTPGDGCDANCLVEPVPIAASGSSITLGGEIDGRELQWDRPSAGCLSGAGTADRYYDVFAIVNNTGLPRPITITASWNGDGYLHLYKAPFEPDNLSGCLAGNDDFGGTSQSQIVSYTIGAGEVLYLVASTFSAGATIGTYSIVVDTLPVCGDSTVATSETCDDGNTVGGDGCSALCQLEVCGNGVLDVGEQCDDGNTATSDGCDANCDFEHTCGDGTLENGEQCDDGNLAGGDGCDASCAVEAVPIGARAQTIRVTGSLDGTELQWDRPGADCTTGGAADHYYDVVALTNSSGLDQRITLTATWSSADGYLHLYRAPFEAWQPAVNCVIGDDDFNGTSQSQIVDQPIRAGETLYVVASTFSAGASIGAWTIDVYTLPECGDGVTSAPTEECDDGNTAGGDGCSATCENEVCGDGKLAVGEECDDGNTTAGDGCDGGCRFEHTCGDGTLERGEECDDANVVGSDGCDATCLLEATPISVTPGTVQLSGSIDASDPQWDRLSATCASSGAADHHYDAHAIVNNSGAPQTITIVGNWSGGDGYLHLFRSPFLDPRDIGMCITGDDDWNGTSASQILSESIEAGERLVIIASTFSGSATIGAYTIDVQTE